MIMLEVRLQIQYYTVMVLIVECNLSIKLKNHSLRDICLYKLFCFDFKDPFLKFLQTLYRDTDQHNIVKFAILSYFNPPPPFAARYFQR